MADIEAVLGAAQTAFALVDEEGVLVWWNEAFSRISDLRRLSPQSLIAKLTPPDGPIEAVSVGGEGLKLVEFPAPEARPPESLEEMRLDSLTGVLTREAFACELDQAFEAAETAPFALLFIDLDHFKEINDHHGHLVGDDCLRQIGARLASAVRGGDAVGRFGGDEFLILLRGVALAPLLSPIEKRLRAAACEPIEGPEGPLRVGVSLGAAFSRDGYSASAEMVAAADRAMYRDKRDSRSSGS